MTSLWRQASGRIDTLAIEECAVAALQIDDGEFVGRFGVTDDLDVLAAHQVFAAGVEPHGCLGIAPDEDLVGLRGRKLVHLAGSGAAEMADQYSLHKHCSLGSCRMILTARRL